VGTWDNHDRRRDRPYSRCDCPVQGHSFLVWWVWRSLVHRVAPLPAIETRPYKNLSVSNSFRRLKEVPFCAEVIKFAACALSQVPDLSNKSVSAGGTGCRSHGCAIGHSYAGTIGQPAVLSMRCALPVGSVLQQVWRTLYQSSERDNPNRIERLAPTTKGTTNDVRNAAHIGFGAGARGFRQHQKSSRSGNPDTSRNHSCDYRQLTVGWLPTQTMFCGTLFGPTMPGRVRSCLTVSFNQAGTRHKTSSACLCSSLRTTSSLSCIEWPSPRPLR
jgi:hypothetical protein